MRVLVVGAGAIGGYFGGRMLAVGGDVTFLVRPRRAAELASAGLVLRTPDGELTLKSPPTVEADALKDAFDVVLVSCKAFDLDDAVTSFAPAVGARTSILPLLNGIRHLDALDTRFGSARVLGGLCAIAVTLNERREIVQLVPMQSLTFGERDGSLSERVRLIGQALARGNFSATASTQILQDMWEKWVFLASLAAATSLMRASLDHILAAPGGRDFMLGVLDECRAVATAQSYPPRPAFLERTRAALVAEGSPLTASMFRDIRAGLPVEADHVIGDLIARGEAARVPVPHLRTAYTHLKTYEHQRARESRTEA